MGPARVRGSTAWFIPQIAEQDGQHPGPEPQQYDIMIERQDDFPSSVWEQTPQGILDGSLIEVVLIVWPGTRCIEEAVKHIVRLLQVSENNIGGALNGVRKGPWLLP